MKYPRVVPRDEACARELKKRALVAMELEETARLLCKARRHSIC